MVVGAGPFGVNLLGEGEWQDHPSLCLLVDLNLYTPSGIAGIQPEDRGTVRHGKTVFGPHGIGGRKMKLHKACVAQLFEANDRIFDLDAIDEVARSMW